MGAKKKDNQIYGCISLVILSRCWRGLGGGTRVSGFARGSVFANAHVLVTALGIFSQCSADALAALVVVCSTVAVSYAGAVACSIYAHGLKSMQTTFSRAQKLASEIRAFSHFDNLACDRNSLFIRVNGWCKDACRDYGSRSSSSKADGGRKWQLHVLLYVRDDQNLE